MGDKVVLFLILVVVLALAMATFLAARVVARVTNGAAVRAEVGAAVRAEAGAAVRAEATAVGGAAAEAQLRIDWPASECFDKEVLEHAAARVRQYPGFGPIPDEELAKLKDELRQKFPASVARSGQLSTLALKSMRTMEVGVKARAAEFAAQKHQAEIARLRAAGLTPVLIAKKLRLPPVSVLRRLQGGLSRAEFNARLSRAEALPDCSAEDVRAALAADLNYQNYSSGVHSDATAFEVTLQEFFRARGAAVVTEDDLRARGSDVTPDLYFDQPVLINGRPVHWVDAKNYLNYGSALVVRKLESQAKRYQKLGPGAFVFSMGTVCDDLRDPGRWDGTLALDGRFLIKNKLAD